MQPTSQPNRDRQVQQVAFYRDAGIQCTKGPKAPVGASGSDILGQVTVSAN